MSKQKEETKGESPDKKKGKEKGYKNNNFKFKGVGLNDEILDKLDHYDDLKKFIKLHKSIQTVKKAIGERHDAICGLKKQFKELGDDIKTFSRLQNKQSSTFAGEDKGDITAP